MFLTGTTCLVQSTSELEQPAASSPGEGMSQVTGLVPDVKPPVLHPGGRHVWPGVSQGHGSLERLLGLSITWRLKKAV